MTTRTRPRKKKTIIEEDIPEGTPLEGEDVPASEFDLSLEQAADLETLNVVLDDYGIREQQEVLFRIYRIVEGQQRYVFEHPKLDEGFIQRERGGGNYVARLFINGKYKRSIPVPIEDLPEAGNPSNGNGRDSHSVFLEKMLMALILKDNHSSNPSLTDLTAALSNLDSLRGKQESGMENFIKGMEMADKFGGGGGKLDWKNEILGIAKENAPAILSGVNSMLSSRNGTPPPAPMNPNVPPMPTPEQLEQEMSFMLKMAIGQLKSQFMQGLDVDSALNLVIANIANPNYAPIIQRFAMMTFEEVVALDADVGKEPFISKFQSLHDGLRSYLTGDDPLADDSGRDVGNVADIGSHGKPGKAGNR